MAAQAHSTRQLGCTENKANMQFVIAEDTIVVEDTGTWDVGHMDMPHSPPHVPLDMPAGTAVRGTGMPVHTSPAEPHHTLATLRTLARHLCAQCPAVEVPEARAELPQATGAVPSCREAVVVGPQQHS